MFLYFLFDFQDLFVLIVTLGYLIPLLLGFVFSLLHRRLRFKKLFLVLGVGSFIFLVYILLYGHTGLLSDRKDAIPGEIPLIAFTLFLFVMICMVGHFFKVKKILSWISIVAILSAFYVVHSYFYWSCFSEPFGGIKDSALEEKSDNDYEISWTTMDAWGNDAIFMTYLSKGDSIYSCTRYRKCAGSSMTFHDANGKRDTTVTVPPTETTPCELKPVDESGSAKVKKLKQLIEKYKQEYTANMYLDGSIFVIKLKDFKNKKMRNLGLGNADKSVPKAQKIVKMSYSLTYLPDSLKNLDSGEECAERTKVLDTLMREYGSATHHFE